MDHPSLKRRILFVLLSGVWLFFLLALGSFQATDWPSHAVYPHGPARNICGPAGAFVAYYCYMIMGQGMIPLLLFSGACIALKIFGTQMSDMWLRGIGLALLVVAFAAATNVIKPGSRTGLPEGNGGVLGIATAAFLRSHCSTILTALILVCTFIVGLLLCADDLVIRAPAAIGRTFQTVRAKLPAMKQLSFNFPPIPRLPAKPNFVTRDAASPTAADKNGSPVQHITRDGVDGGEDEDDVETPVAAPGPALKSPPPPHADIELEYDNDEPVAAAEDAAFKDENDPAPAAPAVIPQNARLGSEMTEADDEEDEQETAPAIVAPVPVPEIKKDIIVRLPTALKPRQTAPPPPKELGEYNLPVWDCLAEAEHGFVEQQEAYVREKAAVLEQSLREFSIDAHVVEIDTGPVITMYEISLAPGIKVSSITALQNDIARSLAATSVRIVAPVPGKNTVGIEVPNAQKEKVRLKELMQLAPELVKKMKIPLYLGKNASGEPLIFDLTSMPHCLIAGTTGSGKSVCINSIIMSIIYMQRPDHVKMILVDPKVVEMAPFKEIPHLMAPVINESSRAISVLEWACEKMDERYELLAEAGVRSIAGYNALTRDELVERFKPGSQEEEAKIPKFIPYWVIVIDELADLMMTSGKEVEQSIVRLAQKARAVGIHLIVATQRPQATVVTGLIKANLPSKIAFRVNTKMDSRIVLDQNGAELLLGYGDMLFLHPTTPKPIRAQGTYIDDKEIKDSVKTVKSLAEAQFEPELMQIKAKFSSDDMKQDDMFDDAVKVVLETRRGSVSLLQRRLNVGYGRAAKLIEMMAQAGIVGEYKGTQSREATITLDEWEAMKAGERTDLESGMSV